MKTHCIAYFSTAHTNRAKTMILALFLFVVLVRCQGPGFVSASANSDNVVYCIDGARNTSVALNDSVTCSSACLCTTCTRFSNYNTSLANATYCVISFANVSESWRLGFDCAQRNETAFTECQNLELKDDMLTIIWAISAFVGLLVCVAVVIAVCDRKKVTGYATLN